MKDEDVKIAGKLTKYKNNSSAYGRKNPRDAGGIVREAHGTSSTSQFTNEP